LEKIGRTETEIKGVVVAVAGAVKQGRVQLTNGRWSGDVRETKAPCLILNDLAAAAGAVRHVAPDNQQVLASGNRNVDGMMAVLGLGTGHGQACRIGNTTLAGEGGHADFAPGDEEQQRLIGWMQRDTGGRVRVEDVLSGPGLGALLRYVIEEQELSENAKMALEAGCAWEALATGHWKTDSACSDAIALFGRCLATECRNVAMRSLATGGVYVVGGVANRLAPALCQEAFEEAFRGGKSGRGVTGLSASVLKQIPVTLVLDENVGLIGAGLEGERLWSQDSR